MRANVRRGSLLAVPLMLLAGCEMKLGEKSDANDMATISVDDDGNVAITASEEGVAVSVPGFDAQVRVPGLELGGDNIDIGGMKLYPGSAVKGINVTDRKSAGNSRVEMHVTSPGTPDEVAAYYADAARAENFTNVKVITGEGAVTFTAQKTDGDDVTITMNPGTGGTTAGRIVIRGQK